jgi:nucleotide-binding universal stress UspA family protein
VNTFTTVETGYSLLSKIKTMKTILVPTDYSDVANNALQYAVELAKFSNAKIILLHAYQIPIPSGEALTLMVPMQEFEKENSKRIKKLEKKIIAETSGKIKIESFIRTGFVSDEILDVAKEKSVDLIVMGVTGGNKLTETLLGSNTTSVIKQTHTPVLVIPKDARYKEVKKIVLTCNYNEPLNESAIKRFTQFAKLFKAKILVLDVEKPIAIPMYENNVAGEVLEKSLKNVEHVMFYSSSDDMTEEINSFADTHKCDWIAMIPHKHNILNRLFHESNTKKMAFHTHTPLLSIHD